MSSTPASAMHRVIYVLLILALVTLGCASPAPARPTCKPFDAVHAASLFESVDMARTEDGRKGAFRTLARYFLSVEVIPESAQESHWIERLAFYVDDPAVQIYAADLLGDFGPRARGALPILKRAEERILKEEPGLLHIYTGMHPMGFIDLSIQRIEGVAVIKPACVAIR